MRLGAEEWRWVLRMRSSETMGAQQERRTTPVSEKPQMRAGYRHSGGAQLRIAYPPSEAAQSLGGTLTQIHQQQHKFKLKIYLWWLPLVEGHVGSTLT